MATTNVITIPAGNGNVKAVTWTGLANGQAGDPLAPDSALWSDRSVQVSGTFGASGALAWEGSNDGTNYYALNSPQGSALSFTAAGLKAVQEGALYMRPRVTAGDGTTALTVVCFMRLPTQRLG